MAALAFDAIATTDARAQGGGSTSSISGIVTDTSGGVLPGAAVTVKNTATSATFGTTTADEGTFTVPAINAGTYTVTVSLDGFKTVVLNDVVVNAGVPASVRVKLDVGGIAETIVVQRGAEILQTQSAAISTTLDTKQILNLPLTSRSGLDFATNLAGVNTPGGSRDSTVSGLPQSAINITIDGMSAQDNYLKTTDGFFARVSPRLDSLEEVTVSTAAQDAGSTGQGAIQIRFVTRSGTNDLKGQAFYYLRHHKLNANSWFNNRDLAPDPVTGKSPKDQDILHQRGFQVGGPIVLPGLFDGHNKAFFFFNFEEALSPGDLTRDRNILHPLAQAGEFRWTAAGQTRQVNLYDLASRNGFVSTPDPTITALLRDIRNSTNGTGSIAELTDPNLQRFTFQQPSDSTTRYYRARVDANLSNRHRLYGTYYLDNLLSSPDTTNNRESRFPGFPSRSQDSHRYIIQTTLRSTLAGNLVNEFRVGGTGGRTKFLPDMTADDFSQPLGNMNGFLLDINGDAIDVANTLSTAAPSSREANTRVIENTVNWLRGNHSIQLGGSWTQQDLWLQNQTLVPTITFNVTGTDPADAMFNLTNFPGASTAQMNDAKELYATLVGRIATIAGNARIAEGTNDFTYLGASMQRARLRQYGFFVADTWRWKPNLTINAGVRYDLQSPFYPLNNSYSTATIEDVWGVSGVNNLFQPGVQTGRKPVFIEYGKGVKAYETDKNNFAPSLGAAWTTGKASGILHGLLGAPGDSVFRAGYTMGYIRPGADDFAGAIDDNPGIAIDVNRNASLGNLTSGSVLLRNPSQLGPPAFPATRVYPMTDVVTGDVRIFDAHLQTPYSQTWSAGWQRKLTSDMAIDIRYVGTRHLQGWDEFNYNEINIVENGYLNEFRLAQQNLQANLAAGRGATFRYFGAGTGTSPLPIHLAYFSGLPASRAGDASAYTSTLFASTTYVNPMAQFNPQPFTAANALDSTIEQRDNAIRAGLPANFLVANPDLLGGAEVTTNSGYTRYNGLQLELNKRLSKGFQVQANYTFGRAYTSQRYSFRTPYGESLDAGSFAWNDTPDNIGSVTHAFKANWVYELPFGRDRRFGSGAGPWLDRLIGGWQLAGIARIQSGRLLDFGNVRLVGMSREEFQDAFKLRFDDTGKAVYVLPQDIIDNTVKAFSVSATSATGYSAQGVPEGRYLAPANGPNCIETATFYNGATNQLLRGAGECGERSLIVTGPRQVRVDLSMVKRVEIHGRFSMDFRAEMLNAFNHPWFTPVLGSSGNSYSTPDSFRVTGVQANSSRIVQLVWRVNF